MRHTAFRRHTRTGILALTLTWGGLVACQATGTTSPVSTVAANVTTSAAPSPSASASESQGSRPRLPTNFPVPAGAETTTMPDDVTVIARWTYDTLGDAAYNFYLDALPNAGYAIVGRYPGGGGALIRLQTPSGQVWQLVTEPDGPRMRITLQTDRP